MGVYGTRLHSSTARAPLSRAELSSTSHPHPAEDRVFYSGYSEGASAILSMKLDRGGWMWCVLLLSSLAVAAQPAQFEVDVSGVDEEAGLDDEELKVLMADEEAAAEEEEEEEEEAAVADENHADETDGTASEKDANVSFQVTYKTPVPTGDVYFAETFDDSSLESWKVSKTVKGDADDDIAKYDVGHNTVN
ncbi:Calnexin [Liparis tanakae]|uniref:Calnexin n=1 Tax=Liparis tanakae TaxID=230148 RepID=A0A4Z2FA54_9TELE|nr:Calnexin [Liparis tanakae]